MGCLYWGSFNSMKHKFLYVFNLFFFLGFFSIFTSFEVFASGSVDCIKKAESKTFSKGSFLTICKKYDLNNDGIVNNADIVYIEKEMQKPKNFPSTCKKCDVIPDGEINQNDIESIRKFIQSNQ